MKLNDRITVLFAGLYFSFACNAIAAGESAFQIENPWVREAPPMASMLADYLMIKNTTDSVAMLIGVSSPEFRKVEMHRTEVVNGLARMVRQQSIEVPANGVLEFEPGRYHLMLMMPTTPLSAGDTVGFRFEFEGGR
ncbi:MAG TPA: copper chaperone PCu(A)C, partial [Gammaproteobacteria bacterium]|nr:copper chaperone PCu(A)C [Gammaproteobacteria bacterium]